MTNIYCWDYAKNKISGTNFLNRYAYRNSGGILYAVFTKRTQIITNDRVSIWEVLDWKLASPLGRACDILAHTMNKNEIPNDPSVSESRTLCLPL